MKKLNVLILTLLMSLNSLAFAQDANDGPPGDEIQELLQNIFDQQAPAQPNAQQNNQQQQQQQQQQQAAPNTQQTGQSNSFDLGDLDNFNEGTGQQQQQQQISPVIFAPASQQIQPITPAPSTMLQGNMLQGNLLPALQPMAQTYQAPPQIAHTGPGALAALIPVAGYSLFAFRRKD